MWIPKFLRDMFIQEIFIKVNNIVDIKNCPENDFKRNNSKESKREYGIRDDPLFGNMCNVINDDN